MNAIQHDQTRCEGARVCESYGGYLALLEDFPALSFLSSPHFLSRECGITLLLTYFHNLLIAGGVVRSVARHLGIGRFVPNGPFRRGLNGTIINPQDPILKVGTTLNEPENCIIYVSDPESPLYGFYPFECTKNRHILCEKTVNW